MTAISSDKTQMDKTQTDENQMDETQNLYRELIIDHGTKPQNFYQMTDSSCQKEGFNPLCGDRFTLFLKTQDNVIVEASFQGQGCAISTASASLMTEALKGKSLEQAKTLFQHFKVFMMGEEPSELLPSKLLAFSGVRTYPSRIKCATLSWHTLHAALNSETTIACTE